MTNQEAAQPSSLAKAFALPAKSSRPPRRQQIQSLQRKADLSSLSSMLQARWKGSAPAASAAPEPLRAGQIRNFKIIKLDAASKSIEVQLV